MPLSPDEELELMELEKARAMALSKPIPEHKPEEEKTFFQGLKAGLTAQPGEGVGHFIGAAAPATIGAALAGPAAPAGAALGEAARQTMGAIVNPEETAKKSKLGIFGEVAGAGVGQKVGEAMDDLISRSDKDVIANADDVIKPVDDAIAEAKKFPTENATLISRLEGIRNDTLALLHKGDKTGKMLNVERANNIKKSLYKVTKYKGADSDEIPLNKVKQDVARNIAKKIEDVTPEIKPLNERYGNLVALENAATNRAVVASRSNILGIPEFAALGFLATGNIPEAVATEVGGRLIGTPLGATAAMQAAPGIGKVAEAGAKGISKVLEKGLAGISAATIQKGIETERKDHPEIPEEYLPNLVADELKKDPNFYNKERTPHHVKADYKAGHISKEQALKELRENHGFE